MRRNHLLTGLFLLVAYGLSSQDIHFSHIHASPVHLNPAMTGVFDKGEIRLIGNSRLQWETFTKGYKTLAAGVDAKIFSLNSTSTLSGGIQVYADRAGDLNFSTNRVDLNLAVQKTFDRQSRNMISLGFQGGYINHSIDYSKMIGYEQEDELLNFAPKSLNTWDLGLGMSWFHRVDRRDYFYLGGSAFHLNNPTISFFGEMDSNGRDSDMEMGKVLYRKIVLHGGGKFKLSKNLSSLPSFIFMDQGPHREVKVGSFFKYRNSRSQKRKDYAVYLGAWLRWYAEMDMWGTDAVNLSVRLDHGTSIFTFSFDVNISKLTQASHGLGGPEFSIIKVLEWDKPKPKRSKVKCPAI
ncbi:MAG: PorP/SprF family type IX secretion system membrane protein [Saprospiraceae bacterium]|nr:PorP/SprF family type IX secretion system membrane protein [Saprospiraceae bacterium]